MDRLSAESPPPGFCRAAAAVGLLDGLVIHLVVLAAWDDQADDMCSSGGVGGLGSGMGWSG